MSSTTLQKRIRNGLEDFEESSRPIACNRCGGNGYMKTSPTCYRTCLDCLGKGLSLEN